MRLLIIEDDHEKLKSIEGFLLSEYQGVTISVARSIGSGLRAAIKGRSDFDIILLDMSMHENDIGPDEPIGGNPEPYAGRELLAQLKIRGLTIPVIMVTMFDSFGDGSKKMSLEQLVKELFEKFSPPFCGAVQYDSRQEGWRTSLRNEISKVMSERQA